MNPGARTLLALVAGITLLGLGAAAGYRWARLTDAPVHEAPESPDLAAAPDERRVLYWYDPMFPQQRFDKPGKSPFMDMELVPRYANEEGEGNGVRIDPDRIQNLGVRKARVERIPLDARVSATGFIAFNERDVAIVQSRAAGFVERVWPLAPGDVVHAGQPLVELLIPEWAAAQREWLVLRDAGDATLAASARERLLALGIPGDLVREGESAGTPRSRYTVKTPLNGVVQSVEVRAGMSVTMGQTLARINGLDPVWLEVAVPEALAGAVHVGDTARVRLSARPGEPVEGRVTAILPALADASRSLRVRVELPNPEGRLRPGLSAQVELAGDTTQTALAVPTAALLHTGKRTLVMVAHEGGRFEPVEVTVGRETGSRTIIRDGLSEGQEIVVSGQFLIDSEANLQGTAP